MVERNARGGTTDGTGRTPAARVRRTPLPALARHRAAPLAALLALACGTAHSAPAASPAAARAGVPADTIVVRNNHDAPYAGPVELRAAIPDGAYRGRAARGAVRARMARVVVSLAPHDSVTLVRTGVGTGASALEDAPFAHGPLDPRVGSGRIQLRWKGAAVGAVEVGLVVIPGTTAGPDDVAAAFRPLDVRWTRGADGTYTGHAVQDGFRVDLTLAPYAGGWVDADAHLTRIAPDSSPAYVALVKRITLPGGIADARLRFNGRVIDGAVSPDSWSRDFWYTRGVDWTEWRSGALAMTATSGFTPAPTVRHGSGWGEGSHFYVWERTRRDGDRLLLISEIAGPNNGQKASGYMKVTPYAPIARGDSLALPWRLAVTDAPSPGWANIQMLAFAGYRAARRDGARTTVDIGVPAVSFGVSYLPYSTFAENFDYYRTAGLDRETYWPFSPVLWSHWRAFVPRMRTDLRIIRAMGFEWVRLHHLELLQAMPRADALAFLDFYIGEARSLGLEVLIDSEGPPEWISTIVARYPDVVRRYEIENEILIPGIHAGEPERWTAEYEAAHRASPNIQAYLTSAGNDGMFERLRALGVPFDRVGVHVYKHGPDWIEALSSHALATAGYAASIGKAVTLGEFNWKGLTRLAPAVRRADADSVYAAMLAPRAIPEFFLFQFQETIGVNPAISRSGVRHYEPLMLDRRPKPEALDFMAEIRRYARADAPVRALPVSIDEATLAGDSAVVPFRIVNRTGAAQSLVLRPEAFDGIRSRLATPSRVAAAPGDTVRGRLVLRLPEGAEPGTYHHFLAVSYGGGTSYGWGIASHPGAPVFDRPVLAGRVRYPQGASAPGRLDWTRPLAVVYGPRAPVLEVEMAYLLANTLQSATGKPVWLSSSADLPDSLARHGSLIVVGTAASNPLVGGEAPERAAAGSSGTDATGVVMLRDDAAGAPRLLLTGDDPKGVESAAIDVVLRFWRHAKDATIPVSGREPGAALGHRATITDANPP